MNEMKSGIGIAIFGAVLLVGTSIISFQLLHREDVVIDGPAVFGPALAHAEPVRLSIPKIAIEAPFVPLGLEENGEVAVPEGYEEVGWYTHGPTPGEIGPAVVLGHVDSVDGPAIFYSLGQLVPGDIVEIERADGVIALFEVTELGRYEQVEFPTELVYGSIDHAGLRLITCSGTFSKETGRYDHNLVVYAKFIGTRGHNSAEDVQ